jgi:RHS repeat-associated protein
MQSASSSGPGSTPAATVGLPMQANGALELTDAASGASISVTLRGTSGASVEVTQGYAVYPASYEGGADVLSRPYSSGDEQSIAFATQPAAERITYDVALGPGVAGVRSVANGVEFLDGSGAPRLRMSPPYIAGAQSTYAWPTVTVQACAFDSSSAPPWGRAVVAPRASQCAIAVDWSKAGVAYPALLDPSWSVGSTMAVARMHHGSARIVSGGKELALVFGGYAFTKTIAYAELFDESSGTWAQTSTLREAVAYAPAVTLSNGTVLALGGFDGQEIASVTNNVQSYDPVSGTWSHNGSLDVAREAHTATLLPGGLVMVAGGFGAYPQVFASAVLYDPTSGTTSAARTMQSARGDASATLLPSGKVLVVDGMGAGSVAQGAADLYDPNTNTWSVVPAPPIPPRFGHTASLLPSGKVLVAGGEDPSVGIRQTLSTAIYDPVANTWSAGPATVSSHYQGTASLLTQGTNSGKVLLAGGDFALNGVELFDPTAVSWTPIAPLLTGRDAHVAVSLASGILFAGGSDSNGTLLSSAEVYKPDAAATASPQWPAGSTLTVTSPGPSTSVTLSWSAATDSNGVSGYAIYENGQLVTTVSGSTSTYTVTGLTPGSNVAFAVQAVDPSGAATWTGPTATYLVVPPSAASVASALDRTISTTLGPNTSFLYSGSDPIQTGVASGTIVPSTAAVIRGHVHSSSGTGLPGVAVTVVGHPEFGSTFTQADGEYDLAVNGGQLLRLHFARSGSLPAERMVQTPLQDYVTADDVILMGLDPQVTAVTMSSSTTSLQVARGSQNTDSAGTRTATVMVPPGTTATLVMPDGTTSPLSTMHVRATEYTVGSDGPSAMPAPLPPTSAYTYAVELSADEALSAGASQVTFSQPVPFYVENFLGFPVGTTVPAGFYDPTHGAWVPSTSGVVIYIHDITSSGVANLVVDSSGNVASAMALAQIGITPAEQQQLATLYPAGKSLWRVPIPHFSSWDCNWPFGIPPSGAAPPSGPAPVGGDPGAGPGGCHQTGSIIQCQRQVLGETLPIAGTPFALNYESDRQIGRQAALLITLSGSSLPGPVVSIALGIEIAGRKITPQPFPASPNQTYAFLWDRRDAYGRLVQGAQAITVWVGYTYKGVRQSTSTFALNTGNGLPLSATLDRTRQEITLWSEWRTSIGGWDNAGLDLGGWNLSVHPSYDVSGQSLHLGDASDVTSAFIPDVIRTVAGGGQSTGSVDGVPATSIVYIMPRSVALGPDRSIYISDFYTTGSAIQQSCIHRVTPDGIIHTFAGQCSQGGFSGDSPQPATSALLTNSTDMAFGPDGSLYIADGDNNRIRRVDPSGVMTTVAGSGAAGLYTGSFSGNNTPATQATLNEPSGVDVAPDGSIYVADRQNYRIRRISPDGIITTVAGSGSSNCSSSPGSRGYGGPATGTSVCPSAVRVAKDGSIYFVSAPNFVDRVGPDGILRPFAGNGSQGPSGDGGPATAAALFGPVGLGVGPDGSIYMNEIYVIRRVDPSGIISTVAGQENTTGFAGDNGPATAALMYGSGSVAFEPDGRFYFADGGFGAYGRVRRVDPILPGFSLSSNQIGLPSSDGRELHIFDVNGRALKTLDAFTNAALYTFGYDSNGRLVKVTDFNNNVTTINRDTSGNPLNIQSPFGEQTVLGLDANGYLKTVTDPALQTWTFTYDANGLMQTKTDPRNDGMYQFHFDGQGRLSEDDDPAGGSKTLVPAPVSGGFSVALTTKLGVKSSYQTTTSSTGTMTRRNTLPNGLQTSFTFATNGTITMSAPDGTMTTATPTADPRFGMLSPTYSTTIQTPSGLKSTTSTTRSVTFSGDAGTGDGGAGSTLATFTEQIDRNGNTWTRVFNASNSTWTTTSPVGRTVTTTVDALDRPTQVAIPKVMTPLSISYVPQGVNQISQGANTWTMGYDSNGFLHTVTDPLGDVTTYNNDAVGRPQTTVLADNRPSVVTTFDGNSNLRSLQTPLGYPHKLDYTPVDQLKLYTPPSPSIDGGAGDAGAGSWATQYAPDLDRRPYTETRPDGATITNGYDATTGQLKTVTYPQGVLNLSYDPTKGWLSGISTPGSAETLAFDYDGFLPKTVTWSGLVPGGSATATLGLTFTSDFLLKSQTINSGAAVTFVYDNDDLLTSAGSETLVHDPSNGMLTGTTLGSFSDSYGFDPNTGLLQTYTAQYSGTTLYSEAITLRDAVARIKNKTETIQGTSHSWVYTYDATGRLTDVSEDGQAVHHYGYDSDDNRTTDQTFGTSGMTIHPLYDNQDRLTAYGNNSYAYGANGELQSKTNSAGATSYSYDVFGNLLHVGPPTGSAIDYVVDGENRRVGKKVGGTLTTGYLYQDALNVVAQLDGSGNIVAQYVFGSKPNVPDYYTTSSGTFRIVSDHLGSPRLVVNTSTGSVVARIDYDEFGVVTNDTAPGTIPFGFAGGLYDKDTGLVRFGARDYDASVGRWTNKDPIRFDGGSFNLYGYVLNDPVNGVDPDGMSLRSCAQAIAELLQAIWKVNARVAENAVCPDPGHDKAIDQAKNRLQKALDKVNRVCSAEDIATLGVAGVIAGGAAALLFAPVGDGLPALCCP